MNLEARGLIYDATRRPVTERIAFFTSLYPTSTGSIFAVFQVGPKKQAPQSNLRVCRSRDGGRTWAELPVRFETTIAGVPGSIVAGELVEAERGRLVLIATWFDRTDPTRPLFDPVTEGVLPSRHLIANSTDDGESWTAWRELPLRGPEGCGCTGTGPVLKWPDGTIGYPFESYKLFNDHGPKRHGAWLALSRDGGRTFGDPILVAQHAEQKVFYWDQRLCTGPGADEIVGLFWTHHLGEKRDLNVNLRRFALSKNDFRAAPIRETTIPGQIATPLCLADGRLLAFVVDRGRPGTMTLWSSRDGGETWPESLVVHTHAERAVAMDGKANVDYAQYWEDMGKWSFGHPAIRLLSDGKVLLAWYAGAPDCMSIHWARVAVRAA